MILQACIEILETEQNAWITIPNGDLETAISDFVGSKGWGVAMVIDTKANFIDNSFHKVDNIFEFNNLIIELEEYFHFDSNDAKCLSMLNMLLEDRHYNIDDVRTVFVFGNFRIHNAKSIGEVAKEYLEEHSSWYKEVKEEETNFDNYFDFEKWGKEQLEQNGNWFHDEENNFFLEVFE